LYNYAGAPHKTQEWVRKIGEEEYNHTAGGLSGVCFLSTLPFPSSRLESNSHLFENAVADKQNEDCGQMSAWYLFSAMGFYPGMSPFHMLSSADVAVDPASATYTVGTPFFDHISLTLPGASRPLTISAKGASTGMKYIKSVTLNEKALRSFILEHGDIANGGDLVFEMSDSPQSWPL
jgi:putative alpha-1,2-mannosidase